MSNQPRAYVRGLIFKTMINKILKERCTFHNNQVKKCEAIIKSPDASEAAKDAARENKAAARAVIAELIIIENMLSTAKFLQS